MVIKMDNLNQLKERNIRERQAVMVANILIIGAQKLVLSIEKKLKCPNCHNIPIEPVTLPCGHTWCMRCAGTAVHCCSKMHKPTNKDFKIEEIIKKITPQSLPGLLPAPEGVWADFVAAPLALSIPRILSGVRLRLENLTLRVPLNNLDRIKYATVLMMTANHYAAVAVIAHLAANSPNNTTHITNMVKLIKIIANGRRPMNILPMLSRQVEEHYYIKPPAPEDLECPVCYEVMDRPVTTSCGHTFCRVCITKAVAYTPCCPLCKNSLALLDVKLIDDNKFLAVLTEPYIVPVHIPQPTEDSVVMLVYEQFVTYPGVPCTIEMIDPYYVELLQQMMNEGTRRFGMLSVDKGIGAVEYGTVVEICDSVLFSSGRILLSTIGVSRFHIEEKVVKEGCMWARVKEVHDAPVKMEIAAVTMFDEMLPAGTYWYYMCNDNEMDTFLGGRLEFELEPEWWLSRDGPTWMWQLGLVMPLTFKQGMTLLSTTNVVDRMMLLKDAISSYNLY